MPIFEYQCSGCGNTFEKLVSYSASGIACEVCGGVDVEKQFSTFSASVVSKAQIPCSSGNCPADGTAVTGCAGGGCPFS